jgi:hypothetical protein
VCQVRSPVRQPPSGVSGAGAGRARSRRRPRRRLALPAEHLGRRRRCVGAVLFLCLFAAQAGAIALSPVLAEVARDLDVSTAWAGQLRTVAGLVAGIGSFAAGAALALGDYPALGSAVGALFLASAASLGSRLGRRPRQGARSVAHA